MSRQTFISYSKRDSGFALKLAKDLEEAGHRVWIDREIGGGQQWRRTIEQALEESAEMVVIVSPNSIGSRWVQHESSIAYGSGKTIIPILLEPVSEKEHFVWMDEIQFINFATGNYEGALPQLLKALQPPNPIQDLLDQQVLSYRQTGDLIGEAMLVVLEQNRNQLVISEPAEELIEKSRKAVRFQRQLLRGGIGLVSVLVLIALISLGTSYQAGVSVRNSLATNQAASTRIGQVETQGALIGAVATSAVEQATAYGIEAAAQFAVAGTQAAELEEKAGLALTAAAEAGQKVLDAEQALKDVFEGSGLAILADGPRALVRAGQLIWVVNRDANSIQSINPNNGQVGNPISVGSQPVAIAFDGRSLWVANQGDDTLSRVDPLTRVVTAFPIGDGPRALLFAGGSLWVVNEYENTLKKVAVATGEVEGVVLVAAEPTGIAYDGANIWVSSFAANALSRISPTSLRVTRSLTVEGGPAELLWDGESLWVSVRVGDVVQQVDTRANRITKTIAVDDAPAGLAFDGTNLWVAARGADRVQLMDREEGSVLASYEVGDFPQSLLWDGKDLWVVNFNDDSVQRISRTQGAIVAEIPVGGGPGSLVFAAGSLWIADREDGAVLQVDVTTHDVIANMQMEGIPNHLCFDGRNLWVTDTGLDRVYALVDLSGQSPRLLASGGEEAATPGFSGVSGAVQTLCESGFLWIVSESEDRVIRVDLNDLSLFQSFVVGESPSRWVSMAEDFWVAFLGATRLARYGADGGMVVEVDLEQGQISDMIYDGSTLWVAIENQGLLLKVDAVTGEVLKRLPVGEDPVGLYLLGGDLWVIHRDADLLQRVNLESEQIVQSLIVGDGPVTITGAGSTIWVALEEDDAVVVVDVDVLNRLLGITGP